MIRHTPRAIEVHGLTKVYGTGATAFPALRGVDMSVNTGEFIMLAGPSGSGKTTLLSILGCVLRPTEGSVKLFGESVETRSESELPDLRLSYIGFVFQGHNLVASLSAAFGVGLLQITGFMAAVLGGDDVTGSSGTVALTWTGFADAGGIASYRVAVAAGATAPAACTTAIYAGTSTTITQSGLTNGTAYSYRICAVDKAGNVSTGVTLTATPHEMDAPVGSLKINAGATMSRTGPSSASTRARSAWSASCST